MGTIEVDVRGLVCPEPVVLTKRALAAHKGETIAVLTDSPESRDNIIRFAQGAGCQVFWSERQPGGFAVEIRQGTEQPPASEQTNSVMVISSDEIGRGASELGRLLMSLFLRTLNELPTRPAHLLLVNSGVKLALAGSDQLPSLQSLAAAGVRIKVCGTCLDYFGVKDQVRVGTVSNMYEIAGILLAGERSVVL